MSADLAVAAETEAADAAAGTTAQYCISSTAIIPAAKTD
jgi:hypothetical protein